MNDSKTSFSKNLSHQLGLHHHNHAAINNERTIAFIRISKNGSTTFSESLKLNDIEHFSTIHDVPIKLCCIRDPKIRFLSSIPETIKRINYPGQNIGDIHVSKEIKEIFQKSPTCDTRDILDLFISTIHDKGFFDSHHEPQVHFLFDSNLERLVSCQLFSLERMGQVLSKHGVYEIKIKNSRSDVQNHDRQTMNELAKTLLSKFGLYRKSEFYLRLDSSSFQSKFIAQFSAKKSRKIFQSDRLILEQKLQLLRTDLKQMENDALLERFIRDRYSEDLELHDRLVAWEKANKDLMTCPNSLIRSS